MGRKNIVYDYKSIDAQDMSAASIVGTQSDVSQYDTVCYEISWTGGQATNGKVEFEYSRNGTTWKTLPLDGTPNLDTASDFHLILINEIGFKFLRPRYTRTNVSATGVLTVGIFQSNKGA